MELISVIVPVYKVEAYLDKCIASIVNQTYTNLEIILVDDGSPDNCPAMCDAWAAKDSRIKVIHKENGGLSDARNVGMAAATGEFLAFVDSDDWIDVQMYQTLLEAAADTNSDIASCGARRIWPDGRPPQELRTVNRYRVMEQEDALKAFITSDGLVQTVWNSIYRKEVAQGVSFPVGLIHEDEFWTWKVFVRAKRVVTISETYYNYLQRESSIMGAGFSEKSLLVVQAKTERQAYIEKAVPQLADYGRADLTYTCLHLGVRVLQTMGRRDSVRYMNYLKDSIKNYPIGKAYMRTLSWKKKLHLMMLHFFFTPVCWVHSIN